MKIIKIGALIMNNIVVKVIETLSEEFDFHKTLSIAGKEMYHFLRAVHKYGENAVVSKMFDVIKKQNPQISDIQAQQIATTEYLAYTRMILCIYDFKNIREELGNEATEFLKQRLAHPFY